MNNHFIEALSGELNKEASRKVLSKAYKRVQEIARRARTQATVGAGLKGSTKLGEDMAPNLKRLESQAKTMESPSNLAKKPKPITPPPTAGNNVKAQPMPAKDTKAIELKKTGAMLRAVFMHKIGEGPPPISPPPVTPIAAPNTMEQRTKPQKPLTPPPTAGATGKAVPMPSTGAPIQPLNKVSAESQGAGDMVRAILEGAQAPPEEYSDSQQIGVDDPRFGPGQGLKNFKGKKAATFTDRFNPTDVPQAFGKKATGMDLSGKSKRELEIIGQSNKLINQRYGAAMPKANKPLQKKAMGPTPSKMIPKSSNPSYGTGCGAKQGCGQGKHGVGCGLRRK